MTTTTNIKRARTVATLRDLSTWRLADMADSPSAPDNESSPGAVFLRSVRDDLADRLEYADDVAIDDFEDEIHEIADSAPDVYTTRRWAEFVDLAAWGEDPTDLGADATDMTAAAGVCLYMIAERLARALLDLAIETETDETAEHPADCLYCAAGEGYVHNYEPPATRAPRMPGGSVMTAGSMRCAVTLDNRRRARVG